MPRRIPARRVVSGADLQTLRATIRTLSSSSRPTPSEQAERLLFELIRQVPYLPSATDLALVSSPVTPWPHQRRVVQRTVERYPQSFLFSDEVGLGKTVEAALCLRQLWLSGRAKRVLLLVPKAVLRQWQEELHEKVAISAPIFTGGRFLDLHGSELESLRSDDNPWNRFDLFLASTQLARTRQRSRELWNAEPWDLVIVDEAHHARRRRSDAGGERRSNRLLELLAGSRDQPGGLVARARCLYLLTATPMQIHPLEVWDLLMLLGMGGRWGAGQETFVRYFEQIRLPFDSRDWSFVLPFLAESVELGTLSKPVGEVIERARQGDVAESRALLGGLDDETRDELDRLLLRIAPTRTMVWRNTRSLLRRYHRSGLLNTAVPERRPRNVWIDLSPQERRLYDRIEDYLSRFYHRYEARRSGLGFVMTIYRRRLTSSFFAVRRSLERRLHSIQGHGVQGHSDLPLPEWSEALDLESVGVSGPPLEVDEFEESWMGLAADLGFGDGEGRQQAELFDTASSFDTISLFDTASSRESKLPSTSRLSKDEVAYLEDLLAAFEALPDDSKLGQLMRDLEQILQQRDRVLIFSQYLDTVDCLRQALRSRYSVACYSGRGGELPIEGTDQKEGDSCWRQVGKEELKHRFGAGEIQVLLCTEAAGEGLNLQSCGVLINYDMPWNPMKVEQRIGRIDRIGQRHSEVWILNYFYSETVEAEIYRRLTDRIDGFQTVVGDLQPILHRVDEALQELALSPAGQRDRRMKDRMSEIEHDFEHRPTDVLEVTPSEDPDLPELEEQNLEHPAPPEILERLVVGSQSVGPCFESESGDPESGIFLMTWNGDSRRVTFVPSLFAEHPYSLELMTWGNPVFDSVVASVPPPHQESDPQGLGLYRTSGPAPVSVFIGPAPKTEQGGRGSVGHEVGGGVEVVDRLERLAEILSRASDYALGYWPRAAEGTASSLFSKARRQVLRGQAQVEAERRSAERRGLRSRAADLLLRSAWLELAKAKNPGLFDRPLGFGFGAEAVRAQGRHGAPFEQWVKRWADSLPSAEETDGGFQELVDRPTGSLDRMASELRDEAERLEQRWQALEFAEAEARKEQRGVASGDILERRFYVLEENPVGAGIGRPSLVEVPANEVRPFDNAVPFFDQPSEAAQWLLEGAQEGSGLDQATESDHSIWVAPEGRFGPAADMLICRSADPALEPRVPKGADLVLRVERRTPRAGELVLVRHPQLAAELGETAAIREWAPEHDARFDTYRLKLLEGDGRVSLVLEQDEALELEVAAIVIEVLRL